MTLSDMMTRILDRIEVDPTDTDWQFAATAAINEGQRIFAFLSLCLETTGELVLTPGIQTYNMLLQWADWFVPLRVELSGLTGSTPKLRPQSLYQMAAADPNLLNNAGVPAHYGVAGWDFLHLDQSPIAAGLSLLITYAQCPAPLVNSGDVPAILDADHEALVSYGIARLRANEGGEELKNATELINQFLDAAAARFEEVKSRSMAQGYDWPTAEANPALRQNPLKRKWPK